MKILHINSYYNGKKFYKNLFDLQFENNLEINVFVSVSNNTIGDSYGSYTTISKNHSRLDRYFFFLKQKKILNDLLKKIDLSKFDLIHAHSLFTNGYIAMKISKKFNIPFIVAVRNTDINIFFRKLFYLRSVGARILKSSNSIIFLSKSYLDSLLKNYVSKFDYHKINSKSFVIPNGIDPYWLVNNINSNFKNHNTNNQIQILTVGDINKNKNQLIVCKALEKIASRYEKISYTVIGTIKDKNYSKKILKYPFVKHIPMLSKDSLIHYYRNSNIFILASIKETFGLVYAEAISQGLPVIYTKGQGFDGQFLEGEVGFSVYPKSVDSVVKSIIKTLNIDNKVYLSQKSLKFNWINISKQYTSLYSKILSNYKL